MKLTLLCLACALAFSVATFDHDADMPVEEFSELSEPKSFGLLQKTPVKKAHPAKKDHVPVKVAVKGATDKHAEDPEMVQASWGRHRIHCRRIGRRMHCSRRYRRRSRRYRRRYRRRSRRSRRYRRRYRSRRKFYYRWRWGRATRRMKGK